MNRITTSFVATALLGGGFAGSNVATARANDFGPSTADAVRNFPVVQRSRSRRAHRSPHVAGTDECVHLRNRHRPLCLIDLDEIELSPLNFADFYRLLIACH